MGLGKLQLENSPYSYSKFKPGTGSKAMEPWRDPVFNTKTLNKMLNAGLARLSDFQHSDGGWSWLKEGESAPYMSCYVLHGLMLSLRAGHPIGGRQLETRLNYLVKRFKAENNDLDLLAYEARVLSLSPGKREAIRVKTAKVLFDKREKLSTYSKALLILALKALGESEKANNLVRNLQNTIKIDDENGTVHWEVSPKFWWCWQNDSTETNATMLEALLSVAPNSRFAPMLVKWLVNHRIGSHCETTRETALSILRLVKLYKNQKELAPDYTLNISMGDKIKRAYRVTPNSALLFDNRFVIPDSLLTSGKQTLTMAIVETGSCYFSSTTRYLSNEEGISASGNEIFVDRKYFKLLPETASGEYGSIKLDPFRENPFLTGNLSLLDVGDELIGEQDVDLGPRYERASLKEGKTVNPGDLIEVELQIEAKNDYQYLVFEDIKPAGCAPVEVRSGGKYQTGINSNMQLRGQKVVFFVTNLSQGRRTLSYRLRAETPGHFHALPTNGYAMYAPGINAISAERTLEVRE